MIDKEIDNGVPINRIVIGGFSMGGTLSMHLAYRYKTSLAGCVVASSFLNDNSLVYEVCIYITYLSYKLLLIMELNYSF